MSEELDLAALEDEIAGQIARDRSLIAKQEKEIAALREELKEERRQSLKARMQAVSLMESRVMESLQGALSDERRARESLESKLIEQKQAPVVIEPKPQPARAWRMEVIERDGHGFARAVHLEPK